MVKTTREQREMLFEKWKQRRNSEARPLAKPSAQTYHQFRRLVMAEFGGYGAISVPWCGMMLCIERDGYCHT